jgi:hypothetical protein
MSELALSEAKGVRPGEPEIKKARNFFLAFLVKFRCRAIA